MTSTNYKRLAAMLAVSMFSLTLSPLPGLANSESQPRQGMPGRRIGGGVRVPQEACVVPEDTLVALMPDTNFALTSQASPTLWFHLPERDASKALELRIFNQQNELVSNTVLPMQDGSGIVGVDLSESVTMPPLATNENYRWRFSIVCNPNMRAQDIYVEGWVRRVDLDADFDESLSDAPMVERTMLYQEAGIWYDALTTLAELRFSQPSDSPVATQWNQLFVTIGLEQFAEKPLIEFSQRTQSPSALLQIPEESSLTAEGDG